MELRPAAPGDPTPPCAPPGTFTVPPETVAAYRPTKPPPPPPVENPELPFPPAQVKVPPDMVPEEMMITEAPPPPPTL
jgi:hypothetical protein